MNPRGFFAELLRRRVLQIGGAYIAGGWLGTEILNFLFEQFNAPDWAYRLLAIIYVVGFPVSMVLAWIIQLREDGSWAIDSSRGDYKTAVVAILMGILITAGLARLIIFQQTPKPPYEPLHNSLAVLPFADAGASPKEQAVADTLYRSLMEGLELSGDLTLVRLGPGKRPDDLQVFAESMGVASLVSGQFGQSEEGAFIAVQMLDVVLAEVTWSQDFNWDSTQIIETANLIANGVLEAMAMPALSENKFTGTKNRQAYEAFLSGEEHVAAWNAERLTAAIKDFQRAIDLDPGYTQAYIGLAQTIFDLNDLTDPPEAERQALLNRAMRAADIAQKLDRDSADAISLLGLYTDNRQIRIQAFERALELDPGHYMSYFRYALLMKEDGDLDEAERLTRKAIQLYPMNARFRTELASILQLQGREEEAQSELEKTRAIQPDLPEDSG